MWKVDGDPFDFDGFLIILNYKGRRGIIGSVPATSTSDFKYRDKLYYEELEPLSYGIMPVYNNGRVGKIVQTNTVQRERDISDELLEKMLENKESE